MAVPVRTASGFEIGTPQSLFQARMPIIPFCKYDVSADGQRFLVNTVIGDEGKSNPDHTRPELDRGAEEVNPAALRLRCRLVACSFLILGFLVLDTGAAQSGVLPRATQTSMRLTGALLAWLLPARDMNVGLRAAGLIRMSLRSAPLRAPFTRRRCPRRKQEQTRAKSWSLSHLPHPRH
jgi:hypothetical protein